MFTWDFFKFPLNVKQKILSKVHCKTYGFVRKFILIDEKMGLTYEFFTVKIM